MKMIRILIAAFSLMTIGSHVAAQTDGSCPLDQQAGQPFCPLNTSSSCSPCAPTPPCAPCPPSTPCVPCAPQSGQSCCIAACKIAAGAVIISVFAIIGGLFGEDSHSSHAH
jgi:hypothetical protein